MKKRDARRLEQTVLENRKLADQLEQMRIVMAHELSGIPMDGTPRRMAKAEQTTRVTHVGGKTMTEIPTSFDSPESSTILAARYEVETQTLRVHFKRKSHEPTPGVYRYTVPLHLWLEFVAAESKGQFFTSRIRPLYAGVAEAAA